MASLFSVHQDASNALHVDLEVTLRSHDLRTTVDVDLIRSSYTYFDAYQRDDLDGTVRYYYFFFFALARARSWWLLVQKLWA